MEFPFLKCSVRLRTFHNWPRNNVSPILMSMANLNMIFSKTNKHSAVAVCLDCGIFVHNMHKKLDPIFIHCSVSPQCTFIQKELDFETIIKIVEHPKREKILKTHIYHQYRIVYFFIVSNSLLI